MAAEPECCVLSGLPRAVCAHCQTTRHLEAPARQQAAPALSGAGSLSAEPEWQPAPGPWFTSHDRQVCRWGCVIEPGDAARADGLGYYLCSDCGQEA